MASISKDTTGNVRVLFHGVDRKRRAIRLGKVNQKLAEAVKLKVETLASLAIARMPMDADTARWVAAVGDELAAKLAAVGLIPARPKAVTLAGLLDLYGVEKEAGNKPGTRTNHRTITNDLTRHFAPGVDPKAISEADAKGFLAHLRNRDLADYTIARRMRRVRSIFAFAVKKGLVPADPFAGVKATATLPEDRKAYVTAGDAGKLLAAASPVWRTIVALCRFAGLRCPSEVFRLRWADVNFATNRMTIPNVKTAGQTGKEYRVCALFGTLRPYLEDAHELAEPGAVYVVSGPTGDRMRAAMDGPNGSNDANARTEFLRLIRRAGLTPWPRVFHTLRASCETDLLESFPISAVTEWLGHSATVALKHYARVPDHLFERAAGGAESGARVAQNTTHARASGIGQETTQPTQPPVGEGLRRLLLDPARTCVVDPMTLRGFEPRSLP